MVLSNIKWGGIAGSGVGVADFQMVLLVLGWSSSLGFATGLRVFLFRVAFYVFFRENLLVSVRFCFRENLPVSVGF